MIDSLSLSLPQTRSSLFSLLSSLFLLLSSLVCLSVRVGDDDGDNDESLMGGPMTHRGTVGGGQGIADGGQGIADGDNGIADGVRDIACMTSSLQPKILLL